MTTRYRMIVPAIRMAVPPGMQMCRRCANVATAQPDGLSCVCDAHANTVRQMIGRAEVDGQPPAEDRPPRRRGSRTPHGRTGVSLLIPDIGLTDVACVHAISHVTEDDPRRRLKRASRLREAFDSLRLAPRGVLLGDFNAEPFDPELWDDERIFAIRELAVVRHIIRSGAAIGKAPLWNPMWARLGHAQERVGGSHYYRGDLRHSHWFLYDQILVDSGMATHFDSVEVMMEMAGTLLADAKPGPHRCAEGDHLPVVATFLPGERHAN